MPLWTPAQITTALWLDAADASTITESGGAVSAWADKSGNGRHATQSSSTKPTVVAAGQNGLDEIAFDGTTQFLIITGGLPVTTDMTVFEVFRRSSTGIKSLPLGGTVNSGTPYAVQWWSDDVAYSGLGSTGFSTHSTVSTATGVFITSLRRDSSSVQLWRQGSTVGTAQSALGLTSASLAYVGRRGADYHNGRIAEIIVVAAALSDADRQLIEGYLAHKWGLAANLPADHPYKAAAPEVSTYMITGVIYDDTGTPCERTVRLYDRATGALIGETTSNAVTGVYTFSDLATQAEVQRIVLDDTAGELYNDLIDRIIPGQQ